MKYTFQSSKYVIKNFFYLLPFAILPAFLFSLSTDQEALYLVADKLIRGDIKAWCFTHLFRAISFLSFASFQSIAFGILGIVALMFCGALLMAFLEKHLRIGKRTYNGVGARLNDNLMSTIVYVAVLVVLYEIWAAITAVLLFFISRIAIKALTYSLLAVVLLLMHALLIWLVGLFYLWLPCMQITGFRMMEALVYVNRISTLHAKWKIFLSQMFVLLIAETAICLCGYFFATHVLSFTIITTVLFLLMITIYCVRMELAYFHVDHLERADIKYYY